VGRGVPPGAYSYLRRRQATTDVVHVYKDVVLRGVMQALVRIQAYVLADIVAAIPAVDLAIEAVV
jgi:hypothetical protein